MRNCGTDPLKKVSAFAKRAESGKPVRWLRAVYYPEFGDEFEQEETEITEVKRVALKKRPDGDSPCR